MSEDLRKNMDTGQEQEDVEYEPLFKPRYWIGTILNFLGWMVLICGALSTFLMIVNEAGFITIISYLVITLCGSGFWFGFSEVIRMLQNKAYDG